MKLYNFFASSTSFRVRIALALKGLDYEYLPVKLRLRGGDQESAAYRALNPQANVPLLVDGEVSAMQSLAVMAYLDEAYPEPPLVPADAAGRARVRALALYVACEIQPLANLRVERYLAGPLALDDEAIVAWRRHWIATGLDTLEAQLAADPATGRFCHGDSPGLADCCLVPQMFNARRANVGLDLATWPTLSRIFDDCMALPAFERAQPSHQPDAVEPRGA